MSRVVALVGAQHGSEGKGVVSYELKDEFDITVRTGAPNAGHSFVHGGILYKMQTIPCTWPNPDQKLILGAGSLINVDILSQELDEIEKVDGTIRNRVYVDVNAGILEHRHHLEEGGVDGELHSRMGSTGEGVGAARRDRLARDPERFRLARDCEELKCLGVRFEDTVAMMHFELSHGKSILLEGTQGAGLSLIHGSWPHVTTNDTNAAQLLADAGLPPSALTSTIMVARTYPIRVAGPSGPMHKELSWDEMQKRTGQKTVEYTTVTKKPRRIGEWDEGQFRKAVMLNAPDEVALTFVDYLSPEDTNKLEFDKLSDKTKSFVNYIERSFKTKVSMIGTGWHPEKGWYYVRNS